MQWKLSGILFVQFDDKGRVEPHINESITSVMLFSCPDFRAIFVPERRESRDEPDQGDHRRDRW